MENPSVGRIVHFVDAYSRHRAAIIVDLHYHDMAVDLTYYHIGNTIGWKHQPDVFYSEEHKPQTWHWPERV